MSKRPAARPSLVDRALGALGLQRASAVQRTTHVVGRRVFHGAQAGRLNFDFFHGTTSGHQDVRNDLRMLRNRSRTLVRDSAIAKRYANLFAENVIGEHGIECRPQALGRDGEVDRALNAKIRDAWVDWCEPGHCTVDGKLAFVELEQTLTRLEPMDGEVLLQLVPGHGPHGLAVHLLDPDQLDLTMNVELLANGGSIRQGVEQDRFGRPVAYHIWDGHPNDTRRGLRRRIPADDILHLFLPWRPGAARGVPWLHAAITNINMLEGYAEAELVAARVASSKIGKITGVEAEEDEPLATPEETEPGEWFRLATGQDAEMFDPQHPTTAFAEFYKANVRAIAMAGGVSYTSLSGDLAAVNYSSIRAGLLSERDHYRMLQQRLIRYVHQRLYRRWLPMAQLTGALDVSAADLQRARRVRWRPRGFPWVDPRSDIDAFRQEVSLGLNSREREAANRGRDFTELLEELDAEQQLAAEYGVDVSGKSSMPAGVSAEIFTAKLPDQSGEAPDDDDEITTPPRNKLRVHA